MSRIIKFRGKRCSDDEWVYGQYAEANRGWTIKGHFREPHKSWIICSALSNGGFFNLMGRYAVKDDTVCQFTGLYDKNGKEIYEGDILRTPETVFNKEMDVIVEFEDGYFMARLIAGHWRVGIKRFIEGYSGHKGLNVLEVVGNKYDNPELLK